MTSVATSKAWGLLKNLKTNLEELRSLFPDVTDPAILNMAQVLVPGADPNPAPVPVEAEKAKPTKALARAKRVDKAPEGESPSEMVLRVVQQSFKDKEFTYVDLANKTGQPPKLMSGGISVLSRKGLIESVRKDGQINVWRLL